VWVEPESHGSAEKLLIDLKPSVRLSGALAIIHILALVCVWASLCDWPRYLVMIGVVLSGFGALSESMRWRRAVAVSLELQDGRCSWKDRHGEWHEAQLGSGSFVSVPLIILDLREGTSRAKWIVLMCDSAGADELRRLRAWLRLSTRAHPGKHQRSVPPRNPDAS